MNSGRVFPIDGGVHSCILQTCDRSATQTGVWLDAGGAKGTLNLPDVDGQVGAGTGLDVGWSLRVDDAGRIDERNVSHIEFYGLIILRKSTPPILRFQDPPNET